MEKKEMIKRFELRLEQHKAMAEMYYREWVLSERSDWEAKRFKDEQMTIIREIISMMINQFEIIDSSEGLELFNKYYYIF